MNKEKIIEILEDYEFFVDDDYGGHYEHIDCSQRALTPLGIVEILDYIFNLEQQCKKQKEVIDRTINAIDLVIELIKQQPTEDDKWILDRLNGFKIILEDKEVSR